MKFLFTGLFVGASMMSAYSLLLAQTTGTEGSAQAGGSGSHSRLAVPGGPDSTARLIGRVIRADSTPVSGAAVGVDGTSDSTTTDDSGRFVLRGIRPGAHLVWVRGVGFDPARVAVTVSSNRSQTVTIEVAPALHTLAPVLTTARISSAYADIGLDKRMGAGIGQFITYDQIQQRQASKLSELLKGLRGIQVRKNPRNFETSLVGTRPKGLNYVGCVSLFVDGNPQNTLASHTAAGSPLPPDDFDSIIDPSDIGAIEVYGASERPAGFQAGAGQCVVVAIWTLARLGLTEGDSAMADNR